MVPKAAARHPAGCPIPAITFFERSTGFGRPDEDELNKNPVLQAVVDKHRRGGVVKIHSHCQVAERVAMF